MDYAKEIVEQAHLIHLHIANYVQPEDHEKVVQAIAAALVVFPMLRGIQHEISELPMFKTVVEDLNEAHKERVNKARKRG